MPMEQIDLIPDSKRKECKTCPWWSKHFRVCNRRVFENKKCINEDKPRFIWCHNIGNESEDT